MNKALQKHILENKLREKGIDPDTVDLEHLIDETLTYNENLKNLEENLNIKLSTDMDIDDEYLEEASREALKNFLREEGIMNEEEEEEEEEEGEEKVKAMETEIKRELEEHKKQISEYFKELIKQKNPLDYFSQYIAPELQGKQWKHIRRKVLLVLATQYDQRKRRRLHMLLHGPPGTGKTEVLLWLRYKLGAYFVGPDTTEVGLKGDARGKEIKPGEMAMAHGRLFCIDELDKFKGSDMDGLLQAMEEGEYRIVKGGKSETFKAEIRVIASANDIKKLTKPLLDRFDFQIEIKTPNREERAKAVDTLVEDFFGFYEKPKIDILVEYLNFIRDFEPSITREDLEKVKEIIKSYIQLTNMDIDEKSYRSLELSILRITYAYAKLHRRNIMPEDVVYAIKEKDDTLTYEQVKFLLAKARGDL